MHLGYFMMPLHHADSVYHQTLQDDIEAIVYADELGYTEAWVGEHYSAAVEQITSPLLFHANLIARTKRIKFATGVICLPQYHPAVVAGQAAMFDHLSQGRFIMGVGPGGLPSDFELFGVMGKDRVEMVEESLAQILALWTTDPPYKIAGKHWNIDMSTWTQHDIKLGYVPKPFQQPHPPIALSAMSPSSGSIKYAGSHGYIPVSANFIAEWVLKTHWPAYVESNAKCGGLAYRAQHFRR
jgi:alkanesulfonate monooxygenase SsuD/methylene tetrahydromethanopterin reductase-like flavin-dependent oxidoreductase (luciferase family)